MPEGDTVWLTARRLHAALAGQRLTRAELRVPQLATADVVGAEVRAVVSRGKHLLIRLDTGDTLHCHLRMDGSWRIVRAGARWSGGPAYAVRAVLGTETWECLGFRVHDLALIRSEHEDEVVGHLGPDLLGPDWDQTEALHRLQAEPHREIGQALLDQRVLAGIGNMYKAEVLFLRGVHPWTAVAGVADLPALVGTAQRLLHANREHPEQSTTGSLRRGDERWVYSRGGQPCRRCGSAVATAEQGAAPYARITFWCPTCQPATGSRPTAA